MSYQENKSGKRARKSSYAHTMPSTLPPTSNVLRNSLKPCSSVHCPLRYFGWCRTSYTPFRSAACSTVAHWHSYCYYSTVGCSLTKRRECHANGDNFNTHNVSNFVDLSRFHYELKHYKSEWVKPASSVSD